LPAKGNTGPARANQPPESPHQTGKIARYARPRFVYAYLVPERRARSRPAHAFVVTHVLPL